MRPRRQKYAYFFDVDGTLVHFAETPARVKLSRTLPLLLERLSRSSGGALALSPGRSIADIDRLFPDRRLPVAGQHGLERRTAGGRVIAHPARARGLEIPRRTLAAMVADHPKLVVEDKGLSIALHYRRAPKLGALACRTMRVLQEPLRKAYVVQRGKRVVELVPAGRNKGAAIEEFMREPPFLGRIPIFIGDDVTDEHGFATVNRLGGYTVKVGKGRTVAEWRLPDVEAVLDWLGNGDPPAHRRARKASPPPAEADRDEVGGAEWRAARSSRGG
jgi:trehalose 6-phosphate phosphatase